MTEKKSKIIDEKGKLFGKINIIDLIVLLLVLAVVAVVALKFMGRGNNLPGVAAGSQITYTARAPSVSTKVVDTILAEVAMGGEHAQLMAKGEMLNAKITDVTVEPHNMSQPNSEGVLVISPEPEMVDLIFTVEATIQNPITQQVGTQEVRIGKRDHIIKTRTIELSNCLILTCENVPAA
ncbi:MAG: DUF4330 domain-containing protein [Pseudoflavonifractor sp.]